MFRKNEKQRREKGIEEFFAAYERLKKTTRKYDKSLYPDKEITGGPVFDTEGNLIGIVGDGGLLGKPLIMNDYVYNNDVKISLEEAEKRNLGVDGLENEAAMDNYMKNLSSLKDRPDYDSELTLEEANEWYRNGNGQALYIDINSIDMSMIYSLGDDYVGEDYNINLLFLPGKSGRIYGNLKFTRYPNDTCRAFSDRYDFDQQKCDSVGTFVRNIATKIGEFIAGEGTPYDINIYGTKQLRRNPLPWK